MSIRKEEVVLDIDGDAVRQEVFVDDETGLDVDEHSGTLRTREESEKFITDVYRIGKEAMPRELERYNKWMRREPITKGPSLPTVARERSIHKDSTASSEDAVKLKDEGNAALKSGNARRAIKRYKLSIEMMTKNIRSEDRVEIARDLKHQRAVVNSNASQACLLLDRGEVALRFALSALDDNPGHVKSMFRAALGLCSIGRYNDASSFVSAISQAGDLSASAELSEKVVNAVNSHGAWVTFDVRLSKWCIKAQVLPATDIQLKLPTFRLKCVDRLLVSNVVQFVIADVGGMRTAVTQYISMRGSTPTPLTSSDVVKITAELLTHNVDDIQLMLSIVITACGLIGLVKTRDEAVWRERPISPDDGEWHTYVLGLCCLTSPLSLEGGRIGCPMNMVPSSPECTCFEAQGCGDQCCDAICFLGETKERTSM